ncbi:MAG: ABC transporter permease, partial [Candidatus Aminicenantes bacterium]|nr:ABC transporter permease [Candidatus Aminicenantes bacterium]
MKKRETPPRFAEWILFRLLKKDEREFVIGDLNEIYAQLVISSGSFQAGAWYRRQIFRSFLPFVNNLFLWRFDMFKNYLMLSFRHIKKHLGYSFINIFGLAIGMTCCILIFLWVRHELSYDNFHKNADSLHQIIVSVEGDTWSSSPWALVPALKKDYPEIKKASWYGVIPTPVRQGENTAYADVALVGEDFLDMFTFSFIKGRPESAFPNPQSVVLTESTAQKYFGNRNPIGEIIEVDSRINLMVSGVIEDVPDNSHMSFDLLMNPVLFVGEERMLTWSSDVSAYVQLQDQVNAKEVENKISDTINRYSNGNIKYYISLFPLKKIHLYAFSGTDPIVYVFVFSAIAFLVLLIACVNFMNLTTARSSLRVSEIGIRKVLGSTRRELIRQFLGESVSLALVALCVAVWLVYMLLPTFNSLAGKQLEFNLFGNGFLFAGLLLFALLSGLLAGSYPAFYFSSFDPQKVLRSGRQSGSGKSGLRKALIVFQFSASILLIIATVTIYKQIQYIRSKDLGFNKDRIVVLQARRPLRLKYATIKERLLANPDILHVSAASSIPLQVSNNNPVYWEGRGPDSYVRMNFVCVDYDYFETLGMTMSNGRSFSREFQTDKKNYIINEAALKLTGYEEPI